MNTEAEWRGNLNEEVRFWRSLFDRSCPNQDFVGRFHDRVASDCPFPDHLAALVSHVDGGIVRVLDVGAGPMTHIGTIHKTKKIEVTAIDPLAEEYARLFEEFNLVPRVRTRPGRAERLTDLFSEDSFDLVYCRNALDHSHDPLLGIRQMIEVCKPGSYCWLNHAVNEGRSFGIGLLLHIAERWSPGNSDENKAVTGTQDSSVGAFTSCEMGLRLPRVRSLVPSRN